MEGGKDLQPAHSGIPEHLRRGSLLLKTKKYQEAMPEFESELRSDPKNTEAHLGLARCYSFFVIDVNEKLNEYKYVEINDIPQFPVFDLDRDINEGPPGTKVCIYPHDFHKLNQWKIRAVAEYKEALRLNPGLSDALAELGDIVVSDNKEEGFALLNQALKIDPDIALAHWIIGDDLMNQGCVTEAIAHLARAVRTEPDNYKYWFSYSRACLGTGNSDQAIDGYFHVISLNPRHRDALFNLGTEFLNKQDRYLARKYWNQFLLLEPDSDDAGYIYGIFPDLKH